MSRYMTETLMDMRRGRQSWRVLLALCAPAFALAMLATFLQHVV